MPRPENNKEIKEKNDDEGAECVMTCIKTEELGMKMRDEIRTSITKDVFIADTGASTHMVSNASGMRNVREIKTRVKVGSGESIECNKIGDLKLRMS